jgi:DNA-3-methyladenine glycosylase I
MGISNCTWPGSDLLMQHYHATEWGKPLHDDGKLFELLVLEGFQAGLSWKIVLHKRENFRRAFDNFDAAKIALYTEEKIQSLMLDASIVRNQAKIRATVGNAHAFLRAQAEFGTFDAYIWKFTEGEVIEHKIQSMSDLPIKTEQSDMMSKDLLSRGFKFVGSTICYAFMQASGMVNDHFENCEYRC